MRKCISHDSTKGKMFTASVGQRCVPQPTSLDWSNLLPHTVNRAHRAQSVSMSYEYKYLGIKQNKDLCV